MYSITPTSLFRSIITYMLITVFILLTKKTDIVYSQMVMGGNMDSKITKEVVCHACNATIQEIGKALKLKAGSKRPEADVMDIIADICKMDSFKIYDFPPPKMIKACHKVMDKSEELLEQLFVKKPYLTLKEIEEAGCKVSCKGVDKTKKSSSNMGTGGSVQPDVFVDGVPQSFGNSMPNNEEQQERRRKKKKKKKKVNLLMN